MTQVISSGRNGEVDIWRCNSSGGEGGWCFALISCERRVEFCFECFSTMIEWFSLHIFIFRIWSIPLFFFPKLMTPLCYEHVMHQLLTWAQKNHPWRCTASSQARASRWADRPGPPGLWHWAGQSRSDCWPSVRLRSSSSPGCWPRDRTQRSRPRCAADPSRWDLDWVEKSKRQ